MNIANFKNMYILVILNYLFITLIFNINEIETLQAF